MTTTVSTPSTSIITTLFKIPLQAAWFVIRHPILFIFIMLLLFWGAISGLALFNPTIAERFNSAAAYFGAATVTSIATDKLRRVIATKELKITQLDQDLKKTKTIGIDVDDIRKKNASLEFEVNEKNTLLKSKDAKIGQLNSAIEGKNAALRRSANELRNGADVLRTTGKELRAKTHSLNDINSRLLRFRQTGNRIESGVARRFTKVAVYDAAGEFIGWIPVIGDAASLGLAAGGIYEMCQMFKEIELATTQLGIPYQVYTDTFCEKPVEKSAEVISNATKSAKNKIGEYATTIVWKVTNIF